MKLSLRTQVSLWFSLAVVVIMLSTTFLAQEVIVRNIEKSLDDALEKRANMVAAVISSGITTDEASYAQVMTELTKQEFSFVPLLLRIISPRGESIIEFGKVADPITQSLNALLWSGDVSNGRFDRLTIEGIEPLRVYTISVSDPQSHQTLAMVQAVESLSQVIQARNRLWQSTIIVGLAMGLLALIAGIFLIRRGFRPMRTILKTIDGVDYSHLKASLDKENRPAELEQLARSLTAMWRRLDMAVSERQKVIGSVSHDLRTPLTALQGHLEVLLLQPSLSAEVRASLERMLNETRRLVRMVKNVLLNVQLETSPTPRLETVDLRELLDEVVGDVWVLARGLEFNVAAPASISVSADRDLLKQMMLNLVDNAIKFTPKGGQIELSLTGEDGWAVLGVSDTGRGIPSEQLPHVTEAFYKASVSRRPEGEGARLGLAIVKQITDLHGGKIEVQSEEGVGTSIKVRLPVTEPKVARHR